MARAITAPNAVNAKTAWIKSAPVATAAQTVQWFVRTAVTNAKTALTVKCVEFAAYASIVSAARATIARSAANVKTVWMPSVSVVTDVQTVQQSARTATKNVPTVRMKRSAEAAISARTVQAETVTSAITARHVRCALNLSVSAVAGARSVSNVFAPNATKNAANVRMMSCVPIAESAETV